MITDNKKQRNQTEVVLEIIAGNKRLSNEQNEILCPTCAGNYSHIASTRLDKCDDYSAWSGRGRVAVIQMIGECGHSWELCVGFHKGRSTLFIRLAGDTPAGIYENLETD